MLCRPSSNNVWNLSKYVKYFCSLGTKFYFWALKNAMFILSIYISVLQRHIPSKTILLIFDFKYVIHIFWSYIVMNFKLLQIFFFLDKMMILSVSYELLIRLYKVLTWFIHNYDQNQIGTWKFLSLSVFFQLGALIGRLLLEQLFLH